MKKRILALLLAFSMMLSLLPVSALADTGGGIGSAVYAADGSKDLTISKFRPDVSSMEPDSEGVYHGNGWRYVPQNSTREDRDTLYLDGDSFDLSDAFIRCHVIISNKTTVKNTNFGCYENPSGDAKITNSGILQNCEFFDSIIINNNRIETSIFENCDITNSGNFNDCLFALKGTDSFFFSSMSASNSFSSLSLENSISSPSFRGSGKYTDCLFNFDPSVAGLSDVTVHTLQRADQNELYAFLANYPDNFTAYSASCFYTVGSPKIKTVYIDSDQVYYYNVRFINGIPSASYDSEFYHDNVRWYVFTVQDGDAVLMSDAKELTIDSSTGKPDTTGMTSYNGVYYGEGWKYENDTLTLESGNYDFSYTYPKNSTGTRHSNHVKCNVVVNKGAAITGGILDGDSLTNSGTVKDVLIMGGQITNNGKLSCLLDQSVDDGSGFTRRTMTAVDGSQIYYTVNQQSTGNGTQLYFTGTPKFTVKLEKSDIHCINGRTDYGGLKKESNSDYYTFTPEQEEDIVLNREPYVTDLVITEGGIPDTTGRQPIYDTDGTPIGCRGNGWTFDGETLTLESGSYDFSKNGLGQLAPDVNLVVTGATLTGGAFNEIPHGLTADNVQPIILNGSGSIEAVNGLSSPKWSKTLYAIKGSQVEIKANTDITNINGWDIGKFPGGSSYPNGEDDKTTVSFRMPDGPVVLNDTLYTLNIIRGTMLGNTSVSAPAGTELILDADEPAKNETFLGWTLSDESLLKDGTLNDPECTRITIKMKAASATAEAVFQKDTPAYTLTVTGGGLVNGKTSAVVEAGDEVCLTVGEMQEGMSFNYWDLPTALTKALTDSSSGGFSNKVEPLTFTMPDLSEYTEDKSFTIRLDIRPAELPDDDDGPSVLGTMATVAVGGAAAGILVWQGVSLGVDSYLQLSLPDGVPVPTNRRELVVLLWETAGKPDVVLPALYGDVSAEDGELQKATRWAIDNGLVKPADDSDASRFDPDRSVSKYEVARAWFKVQQMLK